MVVSAPARRYLTLFNAKKLLKRRSVPAPSCFAATFVDYNVMFS